jgi:hypothetical protein
VRKGTAQAFSQANIRCDCALCASAGHVRPWVRCISDATLPQACDCALCASAGHVRPWVRCISDATLPQALAAGAHAHVRTACAQQRGRMPRRCTCSPVRTRRLPVVTAPPHARACNAGATSRAR